jgi:hypothetical protein
MSAHPASDPQSDADSQTPHNPCTASPVGVEKLRKLLNQLETLSYVPPSTRTKAPTNSQYTQPVKPTVGQSYVAWWGFEDHHLHYIKNSALDQPEYVLNVRVSENGEFPKGWNPFNNNGYTYLKNGSDTYLFVWTDRFYITGYIQRNLEYVQTPIQSTKTNQSGMLLPKPADYFQGDYSNSAGAWYKSHNKIHVKPTKNDAGTYHSGYVPPARHVQYNTPHAGAHHSGYGRVVHQSQYNTTPGYHTYSGDSNLYRHPKRPGERYYDSPGDRYAMYAQLSTSDLAGPVDQVRPFRCEGCPGCDGTPGNCRCIGRCRCVHDA